MKYPFGEFGLVEVVFLERLSFLGFSTNLTEDEIDLYYMFNWLWSEAYDKAKMFAVRKKRFEDTKNTHGFIKPFGEGGIDELYHISMYWAVFLGETPNPIEKATK